jgi:GT2 family glycosyltransferase
VHEFLAGIGLAGAVRVLRTDRNRWPSGARNWGWRQSRGDLIAFLDSDDLWEPDKTRIQAEFLAANPGVDGVYGSMTAFWPDGRTEPWAEARAPMVESQHGLIDQNIYLQTLMIRRAALERIGGFDERYKILEDTDATIRMGQSGLKIAFFPDPPATRYRFHENNMSNESWRRLKEQSKIGYRHRMLCSQCYGSGSARVFLGRAIARFGWHTRHMGLPSRVLAKLLYVSAPFSRMPRLTTSSEGELDPLRSS